MMNKKSFRTSIPNSSSLLLELFLILLLIALMPISPLAKLISSTSHAQPRKTSNSAAMQWQHHSPGIEHGRLSINSFGLSLVATRMDLKQVHINVAMFEPEQLPQFSDDVISAINANFFSPDGSALGLVKKQGTTHSSLHSGGNVLTAVFSLCREKASIFHRSDYNSKCNNEVAIQAGPRLVVDGRTTPLNSKKKAQRSALVIDKSGKLIFVATSSRIIGVTLDQLAKYLVKYLDAEHAMNLDGGSSTTFYLSKSKQLPNQLQIGGSVAVPVFLAAYPKL